MNLPFSKTERINLSTAEVLLACGDPEGLNIMSEMFAGFGVHTPRRCLTGVEARTSIQERILNLVVVDSALQDETGYDFIHWLRRSDIAPNCYAPVILITGHTKPSQIFRGRDAGASFVVRKLEGRPAQVLVQEGRVDVAGPVGAERMSLTANTGLSLPMDGTRARRPAPLAAGQMNRELAWREGKIALQGETLAEAAAIYARYSDTPIVIADPELARMQVTGLFGTHNPLGFSRAIAEVFDARAVREPDRIVLTRAH